MGWILSLGEGLKVGCSDLVDLESRNVFLECFECIVGVQEVFGKERK